MIVRRIAALAACLLGLCLTGGGTPATAAASSCSVATGYTGTPTAYGAAYKAHLLALTGG
jgi:hypothetical protein